MEIDKDTQAKLEQWAEQSGKSVESLTASLEEHFNTLKTASPSLDDKKLMTRARFQVYREVKAARFSRAKPVDGVFFGFNQEFDLTARDRLNAIEVYNRNPTLAIEEGLTDGEGTPLDNRAKMPWGAANPDYQKPLKESFIRSSFGIGRPAEGGPLKLMVVTHNREQAFNVPPLGKPVRFAANIRADEELRRAYNSSVNTTYEDVEMDEFGDVDESRICELLADAPESFKSDLANLEAWHKEHEPDRQRLVILEADVMYVSPNPTSTGSYMMIIEDESTMDVEGEGITVFVHSQIAPMLDFGAGSRVFVLGRTGMGAYYDRETRTPNPEIQVPNLNAVGVWAIPEYKIAPDEGFAITNAEEATE